MLKFPPAFLLLLVVIVFPSCPDVPPDFQKGIRFMSFYDVVDQPPTIPVHLMSVPPGAVIVSGILNFGQIGFEQGPASSGSGNERSFAGQTDKFGISDHKDIRDNANWSIQANYGGVIPGCGVALSNFRIPPGGTKIFSVCYLAG